MELWFDYLRLTEKLKLAIKNRLILGRQMAIEEKG